MDTPPNVLNLLKRSPLPAAALFLFFAAYAGSVRNPFLRDDIPHIAANAALRDPGEIAGLFSRDYFQLTGSVAWRPAVTALRFLEYRAFGPDPRPWRAANLLLHALNALLLCHVDFPVIGG